MASNLRTEEGLLANDKQVLMFAMPLSRKMFASWNLQLLQSAYGTPLSLLESVIFDSGSA